ncbi:MAG: polysaccharide deacetylase family protein [bacterium]|nr:polysaccharide deacetylase family protein [bacterium]
MEREHYIPPEALPTNNTQEDKMPFKQTPEKMMEKLDINAIIHTSRILPEKNPDLNSFDIMSRIEREGPDHLITEYQGRDTAMAHELAHYYSDLKNTLGTFVPEINIIVGESSNQKMPGASSSLYVLQNARENNTLKFGKEIANLNEAEFTPKLMERLLDIQEKVRGFIEQHSKTSEHIDALNIKLLQIINDKEFKNHILYDPATHNLKLTGLFDIDIPLVKMITDNKTKFTSDKFKFLSKLGLSKLQEKIGGFLEKSQAKEWALGKDIYWGLDKKKTENGKNAMALTFDDGPNEQTEELLNILKEKNVKATFFVVGSLIEGREHILKRIADEGHNIGMHEWDHKVMSEKVDLKKRLVGPLDSFGDIKKTMDKIEEVTGQKPTMGRVAGTHGTLESLREVQSQGLKMIHAFPTDVALLIPNPKMSAEKMLKIANLTRRPGKIGLFHIGDVKPWGEVKPEDLDTEKGEKYYPPDETVKMIGQYIDDSVKSGYEFVDLDQYTQRKSKK